MSQESIAELLEKNYPAYLSSKEIVNLLPINLSSVTHGLAKLKRRGEVEFEIKLKQTITGKFWVTSYRINPNE